MTLILLILLLPLMVIIAISIKISSPGPIIYWSVRVSKSRTFKMPKFRTMILETPILGKSDLKEADKYLTGIGRFLRSYSLDELPQIYSVLKGDMNFIGPRPHMPNEYELIN